MSKEECTGKMSEELCTGCQFTLACLKENISAKELGDEARLRLALACPKAKGSADGLCKRRMKPYVCNQDRVDDKNCSGCYLVHLCLENPDMVESLGEEEKLALIRTSPIPRVVEASLKLRSGCCD